LKILGIGVIVQLKMVGIGVIVQLN